MVFRIIALNRQLCGVSDRRLGYCYLELVGGRCVQTPDLARLTKAECCCSLASAWGRSCERCPSVSSSMSHIVHFLFVCVVEMDYLVPVMDSNWWPINWCAHFSQCHVNQCALMEFLLLAWIKQNWFVGNKLLIDIHQPKWACFPYSFMFINAPLVRVAWTCVHWLPICPIAVAFNRLCPMGPGLTPDGRGEDCFLRWIAVAAGCA